MSNNRQSRTVALFAILLASLLWSTAGIAKPLIRTFDPFFVAFVRFLIASIIILPFALKEKFKNKISYLAILPLTLLSTANILFYYLGLTTSTANAAVIIYNIMPLVIALSAGKLIAEKVGSKKLFGIIIGFLGALTITALPLFEGNNSINGDLRGNLMFLAAALSWSFYTIGSRQVIAKQGYTPLTVSSLSIFISTLIFGIISIFTWKPTYLVQLTDIKIDLLFLHLGLIVTVATYVLFQWAIKNSSATTTSLTQYIQPIFAIIFNLIFLGEMLSLGFVFGFILVFVGVIIATGSGISKVIKSFLINQAK